MTRIDDTIMLLSRGLECQQPHPRPPMHLRRYYQTMLMASIAVAVGGVFAVSWLFGWLQLRPDYLAMLTEPMVLMKQAVPLLVLAVLLPRFSQAAHPDASLPRWALPLAVVSLLVLPALFVAHLFVHPVADWFAMMQGGGSLMRCMIVVPMLTLVMLAGQIIALRQGAPSQPILAGMRAGLIAGAIATMIYAGFCAEDSPMFYGIWYTLGIVISAFIGGLAGRFFLNW